MVTVTVPVAVAEEMRRQALDATIARRAELEVRREAGATLADWAYAANLARYSRSFEAFTAIADAIEAAYQPAEPVIPESELRALWGDR